MVCHNEELYSEVDMVYLRMIPGEHQHLGRPPEIVTDHRLRFFSNVMRRSSDHLVRRGLVEYRRPAEISTKRGCG
ncbi:hypothetical protein RB195_007464 [Necator americanus]|uniref:Uncharacterized protein n=1 Tax=Necator americanus TaxID=51031 RepID=A0ABR1C0P1_NECAM